MAAYQAPLLAAGSMEAAGLIRMRIKRCEQEGVAILCCPEAILGGLADYGEPPRLTRAALDAALVPLASDTVAAIVGFTELSDGVIYNSAAVLQRGSVAGIYRKRHPAIRRSVYAAGGEVPVFQIGELTFGIAICNDSNYSEIARQAAARGAAVLFVPTNNGLPPGRPAAEQAAEARRVDRATALENRVWVIRADVAGRTSGLASYGSSEIVNPDGIAVQTARPWVEDLLVAEIPIGAST